MKLTDIADVIRSKNAGPYLITLDVLFKNKEFFERFKKSGVLTKEKISELYETSLDQILDIIYFDPADAVKITLRRKIVSGGWGDNDIYGAQQHLQLMEFEFDM